MAQPGIMDIKIKGNKNILDELENVLSITEDVEEIINKLGGFEYCDYSVVVDYDRYNDNELFISLEKRWLAPIVLLLFLNKKYPQLDIKFRGEEECPDVAFTNDIDESGYVVEGIGTFETFEECLKYLKDEGYIDDSIDEEFNDMEDIQEARYEWDLDYGYSYYSHYVTIEEIYKSLKGEEGGDKWGNWFDYVRKTNCTKL